MPTFTCRRWKPTRSEFNVQITVITAAMNDTPSGFAFWTLGAPGHCAIRSPGRSILLGNLDRTECRQLAEITKHLEYPGIMGADETASWFFEHAASMGVAFKDPIPQCIHVLAAPPLYPGAPGSPRQVTAADAPLLLEWLMAFHYEAVPHDPPPLKEQVARAAGSGRFLYWTVDTQPVSIAAIARRLPRTGAIAPVYTPPNIAVAAMPGRRQPRLPVDCRRRQNRRLPLH